MIDILDVSKTEYSVTEPVSLTEVKTHLHVTDSDNDTELTALITRARLCVENYTSCSLVNKRIILIADLGPDWEELPYGPVTGIESVLTPDTTIGSGIMAWETSIIDWQVTGLSFQKVLHPSYGYTKMQYTVGYQTVPPDLKNAVLAQVYFMYEHKGQDGDAISEQARALANPYVRLTWS
jgi:uncharacterized phiE125 gp8 family phage protein